MSWIEKLIQIDQQVFIAINTGTSNQVFDVIMPFLRNGAHWYPLYLFFAVFVLLNFKSNSGWWMLFFVATIALADMTGTYIFKHNFERLRPCADPDFFHNVRLLTARCSGGYSFTSNHAANHFGMAMFLFLTFGSFMKKWKWIFFAWAFLIAFAQVYVGVHYPADVIAGALIGLLAGSLTGKLFNKRYGFAIFDAKSTFPS